MKLYLSSYECDDFALPREVLHFRKTVIENRKILIIKVDKSLIGQKYGFGENNITIFYLANRVDESAFEKLNQFPIDVHVLIPTSLENPNITVSSQLRNIAWACLYDNEEDAKNHKI